jgi:hypothetical protein
MYNKKMVQSQWINMSLMNILICWTWTMPKDLQILPLSQLMPNGLLKSGKPYNPFHCSILLFWSPLQEIWPCSRKICGGFMVLHHQRVPLDFGS